MKYNINLNQLALMKYAPDITLFEAAILDFIKQMCTYRSRNMSRKVIDESTFTWVSLTYLMNEMPILKVKSKHKVSDAIDNLETQGFIIKLLETEGGNRLYIAITDKCDLLEHERHLDCSITSNSQEFFHDDDKWLELDE